MFDQSSEIKWCSNPGKADYDYREPRDHEKADYDYSGTLNCDYNYDYANTAKIGVIVITITDYDCNVIGPIPGYW